MAKKKQSQSVVKQAFYVYVLAVIFSALFSPFFNKIYISIFHPILTGGLEGWGNWKLMGSVQDLIFGLPLFIPLFVMILVNKKQWLVWLIGVFIPFFIFFLDKNIYGLYFIIFTIIGFLLGWIIKLIYEKVILKKN